MTLLIQEVYNASKYFYIKRFDRYNKRFSYKDRGLELISNKANIQYLEKVIK